MDLADRFHSRVWGDVVPFSYRMLRSRPQNWDVLPITIRIQASVIAIRSNWIAELILNASVTTWVSAAKVIGTKKPRPIGTERKALGLSSGRRCPAGLQIYICTPYIPNQLQSILIRLDPFPNLCLDSLTDSRKRGK